MIRKYQAVQVMSSRVPELGPEVESVMGVVWTSCYSLDIRLYGVYEMGKTSDHDCTKHS